MSIKLTPQQAARIIALVECRPEAFATCLDWLAGDSNLYCDAKYAREQLSSGERFSLAARDDYADMIAAYESVEEAAKIISCAMRSPARADERNWPPRR